jgi:general secretion pathway protein L
MTVRDRLMDIFSWWRWELGRMPGLRRNARARRPDAYLLVGRNRVVASRSPKDEGQEGGLTVGEPTEAGEAVRQLIGRARGGAPVVDIVIGPDRFLKRRLSPLRLPRSHASAMADLDLKAATPFKPDDVFVIKPPYRENQPESNYYVVKKIHVEPLVAGLAGAGVRVGTIGLADGEDIVAVDRNRIARPAFGERTMRRLALGAAAAAAVGVVLTFGMVHWRYSGAISDLDASIAKASRQVAQLRAMVDGRNRKVEQIMAARGLKRTAVPLAGVIEEMARAIPNWTWLTDVDVSDGTVTFSGFSASAARLIPLLEASPLFKSPTFKDPVVRVPNQKGEHFTIGMEIEAPHG